MKKYLIIMIAVLFIVLPIFSQQDHEKILEEVSVNWWQVPIFAVDNSGNPITDLEPGDIEIIINGGIMPRFTLDKRTFLVTEVTETVVPDPSVPQARQDLTMKPKVIFLLFDLTLSSDSGIIRSKEIAEKIIMEAKQGTHFFILTIEPFKGLSYIIDGKDNRDELAWLTHQKVKRLANQRTVSGGGGIAPTAGSRPKYTETELPFFKEGVAALFKRRAMGFFYSFETLYLCLNAIEGHKFIYFFSEGLSNSMMNSMRGAGTMYRYYLKEVARYLSRSGAVLFIINSTGALFSTTSAESGEASLHFLAQQSGGKYLEGTNPNIVQTLENMHRAYYEIAFPDIPVRKDIPRDITINSKRKGISIHTLNRLEKSKDYSQMNDIEKELTAINSVTTNPLFKTKLAIQKAEITTAHHSEKKITYTVTLPDNWLNNNIDLYKFRILGNKNNPTAAQVTNIEKEILLPRKNKVEIEFKAKKADEPGTAEINTCFVLLNGSKNQAYVHSIRDYQ